MFLLLWIIFEILFIRESVTELMFYSLPYKLLFYIFMYAWKSAQMYKYPHRNSNIHTHLGEGMHVQTQKAHVHPYKYVYLYRYINLLFILHHFQQSRNCRSFSCFPSNVFTKEIRIRMLRFKQLQVRTVDLSNLFSVLDILLSDKKENSSGYSDVLNYLLFFLLMFVSLFS